MTIEIEEFELCKKTLILKAEINDSKKIDEKIDCLEVKLD
jgi:hypothetical protein